MTTRIVLTGTRAPATQPGKCNMNGCEVQGNPTELAAQFTQPGDTVGYYLADMGSDLGRCYSTLAECIEAGGRRQPLVVQVYLTRSELMTVPTLSRMIRCRIANGTSYIDLVWAVECPNPYRRSA